MALMYVSAGKAPSDSGAALFLPSPHRHNTHTRATYYYAIFLRTRTEGKKMKASIVTVASILPAVVPFSMGSSVRGCTCFLTVSKILRNAAELQKEGMGFEHPPPPPSGGGDDNSGTLGLLTYSASKRYLWGIP